MWSPLNLIFLLGEIAISILTIVLGALLLAAAARQAGILLLGGGVLILISRSVGVLVLSPVRVMNFPGSMEYLISLTRGGWGLGWMMQAAGLTLLVGLFRNQQRRLGELEVLAAAMSEGRGGPGELP